MKALVNASACCNSRASEGEISTASTIFPISCVAMHSLIAFHKLSCQLTVLKWTHVTFFARSITAGGTP